MIKTNAFVYAAVLALAIFALSCGQYEYASPSPGILEVNLKVRNSRTSFIPFGTSAFLFNVKNIEAIRSDGARLDILPDLLAIRRSTEGDNYNSLDTLARDSAVVLGKAYAPPGTYSGINITASLVQEFRLVQIPGVAGIAVTIPVQEPLPPPPALKQLPGAGRTLSIDVREGKVTRLNLMLDLDSTLTRRAEYYLGELKFYVSSIQNF